MIRNATPRSASGFNGSLVLELGSPDFGVTVGVLAGNGASVAVGATVFAGVAVAGRAVGVDVAAGAGVYVVIGDGIGVAVSPGVYGGIVGGMMTGGDTLHGDVMNVSLMRDTSPFRASARPSTLTPFARVIESDARIVPTNVEPDPREAEVDTCQKTLHGEAPLIRLTELDDAVIRDDVA